MLTNYLKTATILLLPILLLAITAVGQNGPPDIVKYYSIK